MGQNTLKGTPKRVNLTAFNLKINTKFLKCKIYLFG